jgi:hypothetical protein
MTSTRHKNKEIRTNFDFSEFQEEAISKLKSGESLLGKDEVLMPLIKQVV